MGSIGRIALGVAGGVVGFFVGGPAGAAVGFSLGFAIGGLIFPPDTPEAPRPNEEFNVTGATEGSPVALVQGRRGDVKGNIIYFGEPRIEEVTEEAGKGGGEEVVVGTLAFAPVHLTLCVGTLLTLHGVYDRKRRDWQQENTDQGGAPLQISTGAGVDFQYNSKSSPMPGVTSVFSPDLFLGENTKNMNPLDFDITTEVTNLFGDPSAGMTDAVNAASCLWDVLTNKQWGRGLSTSLVNQTAFQEAYDRFAAEGRGINVKVEGSAISVKRYVEQICFHMNAILRVGFDGSLELYPLRHDNYTPIPVAESEVADVQVTAQTWGKVDNMFIATFPDASNNYTQRTVRQQNEAVIEMTGRRKIRTYNFAWFTDLDNASRRLFELMEEHSFPAPAIAIKVSKKFHKTRPGDVIAVTHSRYGFNATEFRVLDVQDADLGKEGMLLKARLIRKPLVVNYVPPTVDPQPNDPTIEPQPAVKVGGIAHHWQHPRTPPPPWHPPTDQPPWEDDVPEGPFAPGTGIFHTPPIIGDPGEERLGYPMHLFAARGSGRDVGYSIGTFSGIDGSMPTLERGRTPSSRWAYAFCTAGPVGGGWNYPPCLPPWDIPGTPTIDVPRDDIGNPNRVIRLNFMGYPGQKFGLADNEVFDANGFMHALETNRYVMVVGGTEIWLWTNYREVSEGVYEFSGLYRAANKEYLYEWPTDTLVFIADLRVVQKPTWIDYIDWALRQRTVTEEDYDDASVRLRSFFHTVDIAGNQQSVEDGFGGADGITWEKRDGGDKLKVSNAIAPLNEKLANRAPFPTSRGYLKGFAGLDGVGENHSLYAEDNATPPTNLSFVVEFPPFHDDTTGIGDRIVYDEVETPGKPFGPPIDPIGGAPQIPTDKAYGAHLADGVGDEYRLWVMDAVDPDEHPLTATPRRTFDITIANTEPFDWPYFEYAIGDMSADASAQSIGVVEWINKMALWVAIKGENGQWCRPRLVTKMGPWSRQIDPALNKQPV